MIVDEGGSATGGDPGDPPSPSNRTAKTITCEACESVLHSSGDVKKKSDSLKKLEKHEEENARLRGKITELEATITELQTQPTPKPAGTEGDPAPLNPTPAKRSFLGMGSDV